MKDEELPAFANGLITITKIAFCVLLGTALLILLWLEVMLVMTKLWFAVAGCSFILVMYVDALIKHVILAPLGA